jgi:hypothetical protein
MRLVLKTKKGNIYRLTDPEASVTRDEWSRVVILMSQVVDVANKEKASIAELLLCMGEQL